jgi:hypothetical protein
MICHGCNKKLTGKEGINYWLFDDDDGGLCFSCWTDINLRSPDKPASECWKNVKQHLTVKKEDTP